MGWPVPKMKAIPSQHAPPPMPQVRDAQFSMRDAKAAIDRALDAWNPTQMQDAIRSAEFFIAHAKQALEVGATREKAAVEDQPWQ